jgi:hypothetical protein
MLVCGCHVADSSRRLLSRCDVGHPPKHATMDDSALDHCQPSGDGRSVRSGRRYLA